MDKDAAENQQIKDKESKNLQSGAEIGLNAYPQDLDQAFPQNKLNLSLNMGALMSMYQMGQDGNNMFDSNYGMLRSNGMDFVE